MAQKQRRSKLLWDFEKDSMDSKIMKNKQKGQVLVTLLFFMVIAIIITSAAVVVIFINNLSGTSLQQGNLSYYVAESGIENALLRLLRDPNYPGETLTIGSGTAVISVTGVNPKIATATGTLGNFVRKIQVTANYTNNILTVTSWKEIY